MARGAVPVAAPELEEVPLFFVVFKRCVDSPDEVGRQCKRDRKNNDVMKDGIHFLMSLKINANTTVASMTSPNVLTN